MEKKLLNIKDVCEMTTLSKPSIYRLIKRGLLPSPIKLSEKRSVWKREWIYNFIDSLESGQKLTEHIY